MFEAAEVGNEIDKASYKKQAPGIRSALLEIQRELAASNTSVVIIVGGVEGAGKGETVNLLMEWMDTRGIEVHAMWGTTDEERERPSFWRFWRVLPPKGKIGILFGSWYSQPIVQRTYKEISEIDFDNDLHKIVQFERMLANEGVVLIKFWMHLAKDVQKKRLKKLQKDPATAWKVTDQTLKFFKKYDRFRTVSEEALRRTSMGFAPWHVVEATDDRYREITVTKTVLDTIRRSLDEAKAAAVERKKKLTPDLPEPTEHNIIRHLDLTQTLTKSDYEKRMDKFRPRLNELTRRLHSANRSLILVFEGPDAAGKGGAIRKLTEAMDARFYQVKSVAAPTDEERAHPYLWRFWRNLPMHGRVTIFDRSWYGRVLVERVEGFATKGEWSRAYAEINAFEEQMAEFGIIIVKFWLATSPDEQLRRFKDRKVTPYKQYKLTEEDWRNRKKWNAYEAVACDMIERTSTEIAPWVLVEANDKQWARVKVVSTVCEHLEKSLKKK